MDKILHFVIGAFASAVMASMLTWFKVDLLVATNIGVMFAVTLEILKIKFYDIPKVGGSDRLDWVEKAGDFTAQFIGAICGVMFIWIILG